MLKPRVECISPVLIEKPRSIKSLSKKWNKLLLTGPLRLNHSEPERPNIATRPTGRVDCNRDALAGFAGADGIAVLRE